MSILGYVLNNQFIQVLQKMSLMTNNARHRFDGETIKVNIMGNNNEVIVCRCHFQGNIMGNGNRIICENSKVYLTVNGNQNNISSDRCEIQIGVNGNSNEMNDRNSRITTKFVNGSGNCMRNPSQNRNQQRNNRQSGRFYQPRQVHIQSVRNNQIQQQQARRQSYPNSNHNRQIRQGNQRNQDIQRNQRNRNSQPNRNGRRAHQQPVRHQIRDVRRVHPQNRDNRERDQRGLYNFNQYVDNESEMQPQEIVMPRINYREFQRSPPMQNQNFSHQNRQNQVRNNYQNVQVILDDSSDSDDYQIIEQYPQQGFSYMHNGNEAPMRSFNFNIDMGNLGNFENLGNLWNLGNLGNFANLGDMDNVLNINSLLSNLVQHRRNSHRFAYQVQQDDDQEQHQDMIAQDSEQDNGLDNQQMELLQKSKHTGEPGKCTICLSEIVQNEQKTYLFCFHSFHSECLMNWIVKNPKCPICQLNIKQQIHKQAVLVQN